MSFGIEQQIDTLAGGQFTLRVNLRSLVGAAAEFQLGFELKVFVG
ncbi:MAG: hypothetical protein QM785_14690 [Pyrinomonadaceae bacterium]